MSWEGRLPAYSKHVEDPTTDSHYLRRFGMQRVVLELAGDCSELSVLDVGSGTGWVIDALQPAYGAECDVVEPEHDISQRCFSVQDARDLQYPSGTFDLVVASMSLMWFAELEEACASMRRVARKGGRLVVAIPHPFTYRRGSVRADGLMHITEPYAPWVLPNLMIGGKVGPFTYYHRPLCHYVNALASSGWQIRQLREWSIDMDHYRAHVDETRVVIRRSGEPPLFAFFGCVAGDHVVAEVRDERET